MTMLSTYSEIHVLIKSAIVKFQEIFEEHSDNTKVIYFWDE